MRLGFAVRARSWFREFREIALMCVVYNIKRFVKQRIPMPYSDSTQPVKSTVVYRNYRAESCSRQDDYPTGYADSLSVNATLSPSYSASSATTFESSPSHDTWRWNSLYSGFEGDG